MRCNGQQLQAYMGRMVTVIVKVDDPQHIVTTDGVPITVQLQPGERFDSSFAQIQGKVTRVHPVPHLESLRTDSLPMNEKIPAFNVENYNRAVDLMTGKYAHLFA